MARFETLTSSAPSYWAPYLFNGDPSGMDDNEIARCDAWLAWVDAGAPCGIEGDDPDHGAEADFRHWHDARHFGVLAAYCYDYVFLRAA